MRNFRFMMYMVGLLAIYCIPLSFIESRRFCLWYHLLGISCYGCGFTRAFFNFMHGHFIKAIGYHKLVVIIPILMVFLIDDIIVILSKSRRQSLIERIGSQWFNWLYPTINGQ